LNSLDWMSLKPATPGVTLQELDYLGLY
jgi:hypothetical protein